MSLEFDEAMCVTTVTVTPDVAYVLGVSYKPGHVSLEPGQLVLCTGMWK